MLAATPLITIFAHRRPALGRDALEAVMDCALPFRLEFAAFAQVPPHRLTVGHFFGFIRKDDFPFSTTLMAFLGSDETRRFAADDRARSLENALFVCRENDDELDGVVARGLTEQRRHATSAAGRIDHGAAK